MNLGDNFARNGRRLIYKVGRRNRSYWRGGSSPGDNGNAFINPNPEVVIE